MKRKVENRKMALWLLRGRYDRADAQVVVSFLHLLLPPLPPRRPIPSIDHATAKALTPNQLRIGEFPSVSCSAPRPGFWFACNKSVLGAERATSWRRGVVGWQRREDGREPTNRTRWRSGDAPDGEATDYFIRLGRFRKLGSTNTQIKKHDISTPALAGQKRNGLIFAELGYLSPSPTYPSS